MTRWILLAAVAAWGCASPDPCSTTTEPLDPDAAAPSGVRAADLAERLERSWQGQISTPGGGTSALTLELSWVGEADWEDRTPNTEDVASAGAADEASRTVCADALILPFDLRLASEDGVFEGVWSVDVEALGADGAHVRHVVDANALGGSWQPPDETYAGMDVVLDATWSGGTVQGSLSLVGRPRDGEAAETWTLAVFTAS